MGTSPRFWGLLLALIVVFPVRGSCADDKPKVPAQVQDSSTGAATDASPIVPEGGDVIVAYGRARVQIMSMPDSSPAKKKLLTTIEQIDGRLKQADDDKAPTKEKNRILASLAPDLAATLTDPPTAEVPKDTYNRMRNDVAAVLNQLGPDNRQAYQSSLNLSEKVLEDDPQNRDALNNAPVSHYGMGDYRQAIDAATHASELYKDDERAYTTRALAYYQMKDYAQALEDANRALALNGANKVAMQISKMAGPRASAPQDLGLNPLQQAAAAQLDREFQAAQAQRNQVEATLRQAPPTRAAADPTADSFNQQAANRIKLGDYQGAIQVTSRVIEREPANAKARYFRAAAQNLTGQYEGAVADASAALAADPNFTDALDARANAQLQLGRYREALRDADQSLAINPSNAYAYKNRALAKENLGDLGGMINDYRAAAKLSPQFDSELQEISRRYNFRLDAPEPFAAAAAPKPRSRRYLVVLLSSLVGGLLIAVGLVRVLPSRKKMKTWLTRLPGAGDETARAIAGGPSLAAGYKILRPLGNGGMGIVYEALDKALGRKVAIKKMREEIAEDERERARFLGEARIVAGLHHPNIVDIHSILEEKGELYLVFEYVEGQTVDQIMERKKTLSFSEAQYVMNGVCSALDYAHKKGVIHRDLKPSNIMVTTEGVVKVMDFGIARQAKDAMAKSTHTQSVAGTPQYMAPEQEEGEVRKESDLFSLGACLYEMLTGQGPFPSPATTASKINKRYVRPSRVKVGLPLELDTLVDACLEPDPDKRIHTVGDFLTRLNAIKLPAPAPNGAKTA